MSKKILQTAYLSLIVQFIIGLIGIYGIFIPLKEKDRILTDVLILETIVQFIELSFYIWLTIQLSSMSFDVTYTRYFDWFISTPIMLITTVFFMKYMNSLESEEVVTTEKILREDLKVLLKIILGNFSMLLFGFLAEINKIERIFGFILGTISFIYTFYLIYIEFVGENKINKILFYFMFVVWGLYGVAYLFPYVIKNVSYNFLDIFSKNFYGLFLYYMILETNKSYK